jgi:hypothetical protein
VVRCDVDSGDRWQADDYFSDAVGMAIRQRVKSVVGDARGG